MTKYNLKPKKRPEEEKTVFVRNYDRSVAFTEDGKFIPPKERKAVQKAHQEQRAGRISFKAHHVNRRIGSKNPEHAKIYSRPVYRERTQMMGEGVSIARAKFGIPEEVPIDVKYEGIKVVYFDREKIDSLGRPVYEQDSRKGKVNKKTGEFKRAVEHQPIGKHYRMFRIVNAAELRSKGYNVYDKFYTDRIGYEGDEAEYDVTEYLLEKGKLRAEEVMDSGSWE